MALSEVDNITEGRASSFPRLRMFVPVLLAGAAQLLKAVSRKTAGKRGPLDTSQRGRPSPPISIFLGCRAGRSMECPCKARL